MTIRPIAILGAGKVGVALAHAWIAQERAALQADKEHRYAQQRAMDSPPERRIALWEARHGLALPRAADHPLMQFIADATDLTVEQVQAEQRRRSRGSSS